MRTDTPTRRILCTLAAAALLCLPVHAQEGTKHDLSASGPGPIKAFGEDDVCVFCHAPHSFAPSMQRWNRAMPEAIYSVYSSSSLQARPGQPTEVSKLCLSCHDGTIALGAVLSREVPIPVSGALADRANLSTDLSDDHPVSFVYDSSLSGADPDLVDPATLPRSVALDDSGQLQCTTCHDAHSDTYGKFLVMDNVYSNLCVTCHDKAGWSGASHATSGATWNGLGADPWPYSDLATVAENACESCHTSHQAGSHSWLLYYFLEEDNCLACHDGSVARTDIDAELRKSHRHPVDSFTGVHDPEEDFASMPRHAECQDCHNPHAANSGSASAPSVSGPLEGVAGVTLSGARTEYASYEYEVCLRCHSDSPNLPTPVIERQVFEPNLRLEIDTANPSYHPVAGPGASSDVPSLLPPLTEASLIYCTDCHANDTGRAAGGGGPAGPHGSSWPFLLEREYLVGDENPESFQSYALCYKCHDRASILGDESFSAHQLHVVDERSACSTCHDPHGVRAVAPGDHTHLINFDLTIVEADPATGRIEFQDLGSRQGSCTLLCHGEIHDAKTYP